MTTTQKNPPDGWKLQNGWVWGTQVMLDEAQTQSGAASLKLLDVTGSVSTPGMVGPWMPVDQQTPQLLLECVYKYTSYSAVAAPNNGLPYVVFRMYDITKSTLISTAGPIVANDGTSFPSVATAGNWWVATAAVSVPATALWGRFEIIGVAAALGPAWIDRLSVHKSAGYIRAYRVSSAQSIPVTTPTKVTMEVADAVNASISSTNNSIMLKQAGAWTIIGTATLANLVAGKQIILALVRTSTGVQFASSYYTSSGAAFETFTIHGTLFANFTDSAGIGREVHMTVYHTDTVARNLIYGVLETPILQAQCITGD